MQYLNPHPDLSAHNPEVATSPAPGLPAIGLLMRIESPLTLLQQAVTIELPAGRALTLRVRCAGVLRLRGVRVWLTLTPRQGVHALAGDPLLGDHFLSHGDAWTLAAGQCWVVEPFPQATLSGQSDTARLSWQPAPSLAARWQAMLHLATQPRHQGSLARERMSAA